MPRLSSIGSRILANIGIGGQLELETFYYPLTNTSTDPTNQFWRSNRAPAGYTFIANDGIYTQGPITNMNGMFSSFQTGDFNDPDIVLWDTSTVTNMASAFDSCPAFNQPIGVWDVSNVTNMQAMFAFTGSFNQDIGGWDVSNVTNMDLMFASNTVFTGNLSGWSVSNIVSEPDSFGAPNAIHPLWGSIQTPFVATMMFEEGGSPNTYILGTPDMDVRIDWGDGVIESSNSSSFGYFPHTYSEPGTYTLKISGYWPASNAVGVNPIGFNEKVMRSVSSFNSTMVSANYLFEGRDNLIGVPASLPSTIINTNGMFWGCVNFNDPNVSLWDVSNVTSMDAMFDMSFSVEGSPTPLFNRDLSNWCVTNITNEPYNFASGTQLNIQNYPVWGTCPTDLSFTGYAEFNQNGNDVYIYSFIGFGDNMKNALEALGVGGTFEWTSPYSPIPTQRYVATVLSEIVQIGPEWRFNISTVPKPTDGTPYGSGWEINKIFINRSAL